MQQTGSPAGAARAEPAQQIIRRIAAQSRSRPKDVLRVIKLLVDVGAEAEASGEPRGFVFHYLADRAVERLRLPLPVAEAIVTAMLLEGSIAVMTGAR